MTYAASDPRASLAPAASRNTVSSTQFVDAGLGLFYEQPPQDDDQNGKVWYTRSQNLILAYTEAKPGAVFERDNPDEYCVLVPDADCVVNATAAGHDDQQTGGYALIIMPPGNSRLTLPNGGRIVRLFSNQSPDLNAKCANAAAHAVPYPMIPPFQPWPAPTDGYRIRIYSLDVPDEPGRFGRIWRCTTMMINYAPPQQGPRDLTKLSPHHHDDFEQCSLALEGAWMHHLRWPWTIDFTSWREDRHIHVQSPSVTVIPPPVIHTSHGTDQGVNQLVDLFAPPRRDFSEKPGWVLNADEYPMPAAG